MPPPTFISSSDHHCMIDLHGLSVKETKELLRRTFAKIKEQGTAEIYIITGRGNHAAPNGQRGVLKKILPKLLKPYCETISTIDEEVGSYRIVLKQDPQANNQLLEQLFTFLAGSEEETEKLRFIEAIKQKAQQKDIESIHLLASFHLYGSISGFSNVQEGMRLLHVAKDLNSLEAYAILGNIYLNGDLIATDYSKVRNLLPYAAQKGNVLAQMTLARCYALGQAFKQDDKLAVYWMKMAADQGAVEAIFNLGRSYFYKDFTERNDDLAVKYLTDAAKAGHPRAFAILGRCYACGYGVERNYATAFNLYLDGSYYDDTYCLTQVGAYYAIGRGTAVHHKKSYEYSLRAAQLGDVDAQANVGTALLMGTSPDVPQNIPQAIDWLKKTLVHKQFLGLYMWAIAHREGLGVPKNEGIYLQFLQAAAEAGHDAAQFGWGAHLFRSSQQADIKKEALDWITKSAAQDFPLAV